MLGNFLDGQGKNVLQCKIHVRVLMLLYVTFVFAFSSKFKWIKTKEQ